MFNRKDVGLQEFSERRYSIRFRIKTFTSTDPNPGDCRILREAMPSNAPVIAKVSVIAYSLTDLRLHSQDIPNRETYR